MAPKHIIYQAQSSADTFRLMALEKLAASYKWWNKGCDAIAVLLHCCGLTRLTDERDKVLEQTHTHIPLWLLIVLWAEVEVKLKD